MSETRRCGSCGETTTLAGDCPHCGKDPNLGRIVGAKFRVDARLGAGGMSSIYAGTHLELGEPVAIKFLRREFALEPTLRKRFRREAVALARLRHPGIVSILDFGEAEDELYAVMELVQGSTLDDVASGGRIPLLRGGPIFDQLLAALEICHTGGVVHRDLKPSNVMVTVQGGADIVRLIDFGIAHAVKAGDEKLTSTGMVQGTPEYMAPEQCRGEEVFAPADIYAVGVMMYELFTGVPPYDADNAASLMAQHLFIDPPPMRSVDPSIPVGIEALVRHAMAKDAEQRPTARELRQELASALKGTDAFSLAEASSAERHRTAGLVREERALTGRPPPGPGTNATVVSPDLRVAPTPSLGSTVSVILWAPRDERSAELRSALGVTGVTSQLWSDELSPAIDANDAVAVMVSARHGAFDRLSHLRARHPRVPVVVVDVDGPQETTAFIRAGASDFALVGGSDAELGAKVERLLRRRQRRNA